MKDSKLLTKTYKKQRKNKNYFVKKTIGKRQGKKASFAKVIFTSEALKKTSKRKTPRDAIASLILVLGNIQKGYRKYKRTYGGGIKYLFIPLFLSIVFLAMVVINAFLSFQIISKQVGPVSSSVVMHPYPLIQSDILLPSVSAKAALIMDSETKVVLYAKRPQLRFSMASTTKIMTALVGFDYFRDDRLLSVLPLPVAGSQLGLRVGDSLTFKDLLYAMLLPSANDAATTIAANYPGGVAAFVQKMNEKATILHLSNTHYSDPVGLNDDGDYTTVSDLALLSAYARMNNEFATITNTKERIITTTTYKESYFLTNLNVLLGIDGVNGIKTGTTEAAGEVLVTSLDQDGHNFIIIVMNSDNRFLDTKTLIAYLKNVTYVTPVPLPLVN